MRTLIAATLIIGLTRAASAGCDFVPMGTPCSTDSNGNTYRTEQNLGGGYNTYKNGSLYGQTQQNLGGGWTETTPNGTRTYNYNPYAEPSPKYDAYGNQSPDYR